VRGQQEQLQVHGKLQKQVLCGLLDPAGGGVQAGVLLLGQERRNKVRLDWVS